MISIKEAKLIILEHTRELPVHPIPLAMALGSTLSSEVTGGMLAVKKGSKLTPDAISLLEGIGHKQVEVYRSPAVGIIVTGTAFNSYFITAGLKQAKIDKINFYNADANIEALKLVMEEALKINDVVVITCGLSSGCYDFVLNAANLAGVEQVFHRISKQPGRPLYFGKKEKQLVFGLPGNPSSVLGCFYQYVLPAIEKLNNCKPGMDCSKNVSSARSSQEKVSQNFRVRKIAVSEEIN